MEKESLNWIERDIIESKSRGQAIITRFPPEPNGYLHIGHAFGSVFNNNLAKKYGGYMNLRMDDTNPAKEDQHFVDNIVKDLKWLGIKWKNMLYASDYYEQLYDMAVVLIKKGLAYVDFQSADDISKNRGTLTTPGVNSPFRDTPVADNLKLFADMRDGKFPDGHCVLRAKVDMSHGNMGMRDPVMYRIMREHHYRTGNAWCIYPIYDFAHCLSDAIEGISHSCCSLEFDTQRAIYDWYVEHAWEGKSKPRQFEFSRLNIEQFVMSKRYLKKFVDEGTVDGWDDPRMPTISGMRRRGYPAVALRRFVQDSGVSRSQRSVPLSALEFYVRNELDPVVTRASVVYNPIRVVITNYAGDIETLHVQNNPHDPKAGTHEMCFGREIYIDGEDFSLSPPKGWKRLTVGGTVRLRGAYIITCEKVATNGDGSISHLECIYYPTSKSGEDTSGIRTSGVIHHVEATTAVPATVREFMPLLRAGLGLSDENINRDSLHIHNVLCEPFLAGAKKGNQFQFVRKGFYNVDTTSSKKALVFNKTVSLKEGF